MLAIISLALLPLGIIALLASLQSTRTADLQHRADLRVAVTEITRKLGTELASDLDATRGALRTLERGEPTGTACGRLAAVLTARSDREVRFGLYRASRPLCPAALAMAETASLDGPTAIIEPDALRVVVPGASQLTAQLRYPRGTLASFSRPTGYAGSYWLELSGDGGTLPLMAQSDTELLQRNETYSSAIGLLGLSLSMTIDSVPFGATEALLTFLPLLMWASAALVAFLVVDRLLIRPLRDLRAAVASYVPGMPFAAGPVATPALEIRELGATFAAVADNLATHESDLAQALVDQTRLTREVHHRVKNNLQVIASLINLHARSATTPDAAAAYASIQRRVDALSIVHRNHYAELENSDGIGLKTLLGELAVNLRANIGLDGPTPPISVATPSPLAVGQDNATAIAFLLTELVELSTGIDRSASISVIVTRGKEAGHVSMTIASAALRASDALQQKLDTRYGRVVEGLSRQLRATLERDANAGSYRIDFKAGRPGQPRLGS